MPDSSEIARLPRHIAVIMDGNGRWAERQRKARLTGHRAGVRVARRCVESCAEAGVETLTLFAFSSENWRRPAEEVNGLMRLFVEVLQREVAALDENAIRLRFIGDRDHLPEILQKRMADAEVQTAGNQRMNLLLAIGYGGRWDITQAARRIAEKVARGELAAKDIDDALFARHLSLSGMTAPDLLIRTGGESRISNFLLWDLAYSEIFFTDTLWPDFDRNDLDLALEFFAGRERRFGRTAEQVGVIGD
jgi:undecaprenyl diphosphate synthase